MGFGRAQKSRLEVGMSWGSGAGLKIGGPAGCGPQGFGSKEQSDGGLVGSPSLVRRNHRPENLHDPGRVEADRKTHDIVGKAPGFVAGADVGIHAHENPEGPAFGPVSGLWVRGFQFINPRRVVVPFG
jgi:hypothetical protein